MSGIYIKNWSLADWKELLKWAKIGANNAMIGEFTEVKEVPDHGRLIDADAIHADIDEKRPGRSYEDAWALTVINAAPTIIPADKEDKK